MGQYTPAKTIDINTYKEDLKIGLVSTEWNAPIIARLMESCTQALKEAGLTADQLVEIKVPGAYELPLGAKLLMEHHKTDAIICLGCVIKGETSHDEYINRSVASALMQLSLMTDRPVIFGVLTTLNEKQAMDRSGGAKGDKGRESALSALKMIDLKRSLGGAKKKIGF